MATELIGMVPVKLFNRKCSGIIFGEQLFKLNNYKELILSGQPWHMGQGSPHGPADRLVGAVGPLGPRAGGGREKERGARTPSPCEN